MNITALPAFSDNYVWMFHDGSSAVVVDPGEAAPVVAALDAGNLELAGILVTHHHADHVGGVDALRPRLRGSVYGPARERIPTPFTAVTEGDAVEVLGVHFQVIDVPGHTAGHIAYYTPSLAAPGEAAGRPVLFCGDTLFSGGCGRLFEGTPAQMHGSLAKLTALPSGTQVCCAHEYTLSNLRFARAVEPHNEDLAAYEGWCVRQREAGLPTLPSSLELECKVNPFLRCGVPEVVASAQHHGAPLHADEVEVLAALRQWKNEYR